MKKVLLTLLGLVLVVGVLGVAGLTGYRYGLANAFSYNNSNTPSLPRGGFDWDEMPMHRFGFNMGPNMHRGFGFGGAPMMGGGFWFFGLFRVFIQLAILGIIVWLVYKFVTGWRLTLTPPSTRTITAAPTPPTTENPNETSN